LEEENKKLQKTFQKFIKNEDLTATSNNGNGHNNEFIDILRKPN